MKMRNIAILAALAALAAGAGADDEFSPPRIPDFLARQIVVDPAGLAPWHDLYHSRKKNGSRADFMLAFLPSRLISGLAGNSGADDLRASFGLLYWSGVEGGVWLNRMFQDAGQDRIGSPLMKKPAELYASGFVSGRIRLLASGRFKRKMEEADKTLDLLIASYGYNRGYFEEILRHPPGGQTTEQNYLHCSGLLRCQYADADQTGLDPLQAVREKIENPGSVEWQEIAGRFYRQLPGAIMSGRSVWSRISSSRSFSGESYPTLLSLSGQFLVINEQVMLSCADAVASGEDAKLNSCLASDAGFRVWLAGYMAGLGEKSVR